MSASENTAEIHVNQSIKGKDIPSPPTPINEEGLEPLAGHENLLRIIAQVQEIPDTFGLCKVLATHTSGVLHAAQSWEALTYDPRQLKRSFDIIINERATKSTKQLTPGPAFTKLYGREGLRLFINQPLAIDDPQKTKDKLLTYQPEDNGLNIGVILKYPNLEGQHLHWWTVVDVDPKGNTILLGGDFSPIGSKAWFNHFSLDDIASRTALVVGHEGTTTLQPALANNPTTEYQGSFKMNMEELTFTGKILENKLYQFHI